MDYTSLQAHKIVQQASHILQQEQGPPHCLVIADLPSTARVGSRFSWMQPLRCVASCVVAPSLS